MKIFIVVPAFNESKHITAVIDDLQRHGYNNIVVVDDGSTDNTAALARQRGVVVLRHLVNRGMGAALQTGNTYALQQGADIVVHFDGDGQMQAKDIAKVVAPIIAGEVEVVFGSRFLDNTSQIPWSKKHLLLPVSRVINFFFTGLWLSDAHNGFRALSRSALSQIYISYDGMAHNSEIVEQVRKKRLSFCEVPVTIIYHRYGQSIAGGIKIVRDLILGKILK